MKNDTEEEIAEIARFAHEKMRVDEINLLPYHRLGKDKYKGLGREYLMGDAEPPSDEKMKKKRKTAADFGLMAKVGG